MLTLFNVTLGDVTAPTRRAAILALATLTLLLPIAPAQASPATIGWPTYLRTGPGREFAVLQELARGAPVDVLACTGHWCSVRLDRGTGYVEQSNLDRPTSPPSPKTTAAGCFDSQRAGYDNGEPFRYCPR